MVLQWRTHGLLGVLMLVNTAAIVDFNDQHLEPTKTPFFLMKHLSASILLSHNHLMK